MDIWSLGITCIELAEKKPPLFDMNPMSTLYHIPQNDAPTLTNPSKWSPDFVNYVGLCLTKDPADRAPISQLIEVGSSYCNIFFQFMDCTSRQEQPAIQENSLTSNLLVLFCFVLFVCFDEV